MSYPTQMIPQFKIAGVDVTAHVDPTKSTCTNVLTKQVDTAELYMFNVAALGSGMAGSDHHRPGQRDEAVRRVRAAGTVTSFAGGTRLDISPLHCADYSCLFDHIRIKKSYAPVNSTITDQAIIQDLLSTYCSVIDTSTYVQAVNSYPRISFSSNTLRAILDQLASAANGFWYVDYNKSLHFGLCENNPAPFGISDNLAHMIWQRCSRSATSSATSTGRAS